MPKMKLECFGDLAISSLYFEIASLYLYIFFRGLRPLIRRRKNDFESYMVAVRRVAALAGHLFFPKQKAQLKATMISCWWWGFKIYSKGDDEILRP